MLYRARISTPLHHHDHQPSAKPCLSATHYNEATNAVAATTVIAGCVSCSQPNMCVQSIIHAPIPPLAFSIFLDEIKENYEHFIC